MQRKDRAFLCGEDERGKERKERPKEQQTSRERRVPEKSGRWLFLLFLLRQNWLCVNAAAEGLQRGTEMMERMQQEVQVKGGRWAERFHKGGESQRSRQD